MLDTWKDFQIIKQLTDFLNSRLKLCCSHSTRYFINKIKIRLNETLDYLRNWVEWGTQMTESIDNFHNGQK